MAKHDDYGVSDDVLQRGYSDELPAGARAGRTDQNGNDILDYELPEREDRAELMSPVPWPGRDEWEKERMQGGFLERAGLSDSDYGKGTVKRN